jgi:hypothetical protein
MDVIFGLGQAGCNIARRFEQYSQYDVYKIDAGRRGKNCISIPKKPSHEAYNAAEYPKFEEIAKEYEDRDVLFVIGGSGNISGASLKIIKHFDQSRVNVLYVSSDPSLLTDIRFLQDRATFHILQEYARSGMVNCIYLVSNKQIEDMVGGIPVKKYFDTINEHIVSSIHMTNIFKNTKAVINSISDVSEICRIATFGLMDVDSGTENLFFPIDNLVNKCYHYAIVDKDLDEDKNLLKNIKKQVLSQSSGKIRASYSIHSSKYDRNLCYLTAFSSQVQKYENI